MLKLSVIMPCYNSAAHLAETFDSLLAQDFSHRWELIVINRGSTDATANIIASYRERFSSCTVVSDPKNFGVSFSRNEGASLARSEKLLFVDSDDLYDAGYLSALNAALDRRDFVCAKVDFFKANQPWLVAVYASELDGGTEHPIAPMALGNNIGVTSAAHAQIGGFDESIRALEDADYSWRMLNSGRSVTVVASAVVHYRKAEDLRSLFRKARTGGFYNPIVIKKNFPGIVPRGLSMAGFAARGLLLLARALTLWTRSRFARWLLDCGYWVGELQGCLRSHLVSFLPKGSLPRKPSMLELL